MSVAIMLAFTLVAVTFLLHYRKLLWLGASTPSLRWASYGLGITNAANCWTMRFHMMFPNKRDEK